MIKKPQLDHIPVSSTIFQNGFCTPTFPRLTCKGTVEAGIRSNATAAHFYVARRHGSGRSWFTSPLGPVDRSRAIFLDVMEFVAKLGDPKYSPKGVDTSSWPKYEGGNAMQFYQEAYEVFLQTESQVRARMVNLIVKSTMRVKEEAEGWLRLYEQAGYRICGYYMYASPDEKRPM